MKKRLWIFVLLGTAWAINQTAQYFFDDTESGSLQSVETDFAVDSSGFMTADRQ
jgi:hypothetical protein